MLQLSDIAGSYIAIFFNFSVIAVCKDIIAPELKPKIYSAFVLLIIACISSTSNSKF